MEISGRYKILLNVPKKRCGVNCRIDLVQLVGKVQSDGLNMDSMGISSLVVSEGVLLEVEKNICEVPRRRRLHLRGSCCVGKFVKGRATD